MGENKLSVQMFGGFTMEYQGRAISFERNTATKTNQLLQILFCAGEKGVPREKLMDMLFGRDEITNPSNSLRATVFRLRKLLAAANLPECAYIVIGGGVYRWTGEIPVELDITEFEEWSRKAEEAEASGDIAEEIKCLKNACEIYKGEFLPLLAAEEWVVVRSVRYKALYNQNLQKLAGIMMERGEYEDLLSYCTLAAAMYPFEEWQVYQVKCLMALNRNKEAIQIYEETSKMYFEELGLSPSEQMMEQIKKIGGQIKNTAGAALEIRDDLQEKDEKYGAYYCTYPNFVDSYRYMERVIERTGQSAYLMICTLVDGKGNPIEGGVRLKEISRLLKNAINRSLRKGDLFTQYSPNQYLMLLLEIKQEDCKIVMKRIEDNLLEKGKRNCLKFNASALADVQESKGDFHFEESKSIWK